MRIATWNVNGLRARLDLVRQWLADRQPDCVALQELKTAADQFPERELEESGYSSYFLGQKAWNGVAVLTKTSAAVLASGLPGMEGAGSRFLGVSVGDLRIFSAYCPNGKDIAHRDFALKLRWLERLRDFLETSCSAADPIFLCGDLNVAPAALDTCDEAASQGQLFHTSAERQSFRDLLAWGLDDVFRAQHPQAREFTWWDYRAGAFHRDIGLRIDFLLATRPASVRVRNVVIDRDYRKKKDGFTPSDHAPVFADLE
ncbi:MAG: exodeoxyribonuclease III [Candidatus Schekmanbacteria bacterium]|nr:exodeoxyribonuclease III [Candidatus Schekmanbacteria bacterium]